MPANNMAKGTNQKQADGSALKFEAQLWAAADKMRGHMDEDVMRAYSNAVRPIFDRIKNNCFESRTPAALRDALLPKLLSGELRVPAAAKLTEFRA